MSRNGKIAFGIITIILVFVSCGIGMGFIPDGVKYEFIFRFLLIFTPCMTVLCVINLLKESR